MSFKERCENAFAKHITAEAISKELAINNMADRSRLKAMKDFDTDDVEIKETLTPNNCLLRIGDLTFEVLETLYSQTTDKKHEYKLTFFCENCGKTSTAVVLRHTFNWKIETGRILKLLDDPIAWQHQKYCSKCGYYDKEKGKELLRPNTVKKTHKEKWHDENKIL